MFLDIFPCQYIQVIVAQFSIVWLYYNKCNLSLVDEILVSNFSQLEAMLQRVSLYLYLCTIVKVFLQYSIRIAQI